MKDKMCPILTVAQAVFLIPLNTQRGQLLEIGSAWAACVGDDCAMYERCFPLSLGPDDDMETERYLESRTTLCGASDDEEG